MFSSRTWLERGHGTRILLFYLGVIVLIWELKGWILDDDLLHVVFIPVAFIALAVVGVILKDWRLGIFIFIGWLLFEDFVRKYMGNNMVIYFAKDAILAVVYYSFLQARLREKRSTFRSLFLIPLGLFVALGVVQMFNPGSPNILYGCLGIKVYFYYLPLMFLGYALIRDENDLDRFLAFNLLLAGIIASVGILQSIFGLSFLNPRNLAPELAELGNLTRMTYTGLSVPRPPSVFVSDGRFTSYLTLVFPIGFGALGFVLLKKIRNRRMLFVYVGLVCVAAVMSGSRGCVSWVAICALVLSVCLLWGSPPGGVAAYRLFGAIRRAYTMAAFGLILMAVVFPKQIGASWEFYAETLNPRSAHFEVGFRAWDYPYNNFVTQFYDPDWVTGHGIGTSSLGVQYVARIVGPDVDASIHRWGLESGWANLIFELGILGLILWWLWTLAYIHSAANTVLRLKGTPLFPVAVSILWYGFLLLFPYTFSGSVAYENYVLNAYFWLLTGILFRLPSLATEESAELVPDDPYASRQSPGRGPESDASADAMAQDMR